jgi:hypothetical protein
MVTKRTIIGAHAFFFPAGAAFTVPSAGTSGRAAKPGSADTGWLDCGVSDWDLVPKNEVDDFYAPMPGARVLYDKITKKRGLKLKGKLMEMQNLSWQMILGTLTLPNSPAAGGQYNPLEGDPVVRGWLQLQQFDQGNVLINTMDVFVALAVPGDVSFGDAPVDVTVEADVLFSTLNTGTLT